MCAAGRRPAAASRSTLALEATLIAAAAERGVLVEAGDPFVAPEMAGRFFRLGLSAIDWQLIEPGIAEIAKAVAAMRREPVAG